MDTIVNSLVTLTMTFTLKITILDLVAFRLMNILFHQDAEPGKSSEHEKSIESVPYSSVEDKESSSSIEEGGVKVKKKKQKPRFVIHEGHRGGRSQGQKEEEEAKVCYTCKV